MKFAIYTSLGGIVSKEEDYSVIRNEFNDFEM